MSQEEETTRFAESRRAGNGNANGADLLLNLGSHNHVWDIREDTVIGENLLGQIVKCRGEFRKCTDSQCLAEEFRRL